MAFFNFGYIESAVRSAASSSVSRSTGPIPVATITNYTGDIARSQIAYAKILGGRFDYLWGSHLWGDSKYKVTK
jgi:hypothetical protein